MRLTEITDPLKDLELTMLLRSTDSHVSQEQAEKTAHFLQNAAQIIGGAQKRPLTCYLDKKTGTLRITGSTLSSSWNSQPGRKTRFQIMKQLSSLGYKVAYYELHATNRTDLFSLPIHHQNHGSHIYFW